MTEELIMRRLGLRPWHDNCKVVAQYWRELKPQFTKATYHQLLRNKRGIGSTTRMLVKALQVLCTGGSIYLVNSSQRPYRDTRRLYDRLCDMCTQLDLDNTYTNRIYTGKRGAPQDVATFDDAENHLHYAPMFGVSCRNK